MHEYEATNYSMGRKIKTVRFFAYSDADAAVIAEKRAAGANGLPGSHPRAAARSQVIGVRKTGVTR